MTNQCLICVKNWHSHRPRSLKYGSGARCTASIVHRLSRRHYNLPNPPGSSHPLSRAVIPTRGFVNPSQMLHRISASSSGICGPIVGIRCGGTNEGVKLPGLDVLRRLSRSGNSLCVCHGSSTNSEPCTNSKHFKVVTCKVENCTC